MKRLENCCCCGSVERGSLILAVIGIVFGVLGLVGAVLTLNFPRIISLGVSLAFSGMLYHGVKSRKPGFVLAYAIMQAIGLVFMAIITIILIVAAVAFSAGFVEFMYDHPEIFGPMDENPEVKENLEKIAPIIVWVMVVLFVFVLAMEFYFFLVVYSHYQNLRDELYGGSNYNAGLVEDGKGFKSLN